jgi:hypothetical protein
MPILANVINYSIKFDMLILLEYPSNRALSYYYFTNFQCSPERDKVPVPYELSFHTFEFAIFGCLLTFLSLYWLRDQFNLLWNIEAKSI